MGQQVFQVFLINRYHTAGIGQKIEALIIFHSSHFSFIFKQMCNLHKAFGQESWYVAVISQSTKGKRTSYTCLIGL